MKNFFKGLWRSVVIFLSDNDPQFDQGRNWVVGELINFKQPISAIKRHLEHALYGGYYHDFEMGAADMITRLEQIFDPDRRKWVPVTSGVELEVPVLGRSAVGEIPVVVYFSVKDNGETWCLFYHNDEIVPFPITMYIPIEDLV